jgi:Tfp pilus assembly protein PilO
MTRTILPIILLAAAIGLFVMYTNGTYTGDQALAAEHASYQAALGTAKELRQQRDQLLAKRNTFSTDDVQKLQRMLPDTVDNIRLIIDINNIAARHNLSLKNVVLGDVSSGSVGKSATAVGSSGDPVGSVTLGFTVSAGYNDFRAFLADLEHSLRIINVEKIDLKEAPGPSGVTTDLNDYQLTIRTYWLH